MLASLFSALRGWRRRAYWESRWGRPDYTACWLDRGVSPEVVTAVDEGWFPPGTAALDAGCGRGEVAAWLAERGFQSLGVDISPSAIAQAETLHGDGGGRLEFRVLDACAEPLPASRFHVVVDRGCFHQIHARDVPAYVHNLANATVPGGRLMLFVRAFRDGEPFGDPEHVRQHRERVVAAFGANFELLDVAATWLDAHRGKDPERAYGGLVFRLVRRGLVVGSR
jgi:SAM-dependent methyltransferase